jgi:hypothetical protein
VRFLAASVVVLVLVLVATALASWPSSHSGAGVTTTSRTTASRATGCTTYSLEAGSGAVQTYVDAAEIAYRDHTRLCPRAGLRLTVAGTIRVANPAYLDFNGARLTKAAGFDGWVLEVAAGDVSVLNVAINGNRTAHAGGGGIEWLGGAGGLMDDVHVSGTSTDGVEVVGSRASVAIEQSSSDFNGVSTMTGDGFAVGEGAHAEIVGGEAAHNDRIGYFFFRAGSGSSLDGASSYNRFAGIQVEATNSLAIPAFTSTADWHYGLYIGGDSSDCSIGHLRIVNTGIAQGQLPTSGYGDAIEFFGATHCRVDTLHLADDTFGGVGLESSNGNVFKDVVATDVGSQYASLAGNALVRLIGTASGNIFSHLAVSTTPSTAQQTWYRMPEYIVFAGTSTSDNKVTVSSVSGSTFTRAAFSGEPGGSRFTIHA